MEVIQVPPADRLKPVDILRSRTFFILNDCLDEELLKTALDRLIREHWRKLGARLVTGKDGLLEYHLPRTFDPKYTLFSWSSQSYGRSIENAASLPRATAPAKGATLHPPLSSMEGWLAPSTWPVNRKDEAPDAPLLYIHLSKFNDATIVGINCPHVVGDQFGLANIVRAWLGQTRGEAPPPMIGAHEDVLASGKAYADYRKEEVRRKGKIKVRRRFEYPFVIMGFIPELVMHKKEVGYTVFLPLPLLESLRERHGKTIEKTYGSNPGISTGDIITGILCKLTRMHDKAPRTTALTQTVNLRGRVPELEHGGEGFVHNSLHYATARLRIDAATTVAEIAYRNRLAITEALDPRDIEVGKAVRREMVRRGQGIHICEPFERSVNVSNWAAAWKGLDFRSAVRGQVAGETGRDPLHMLVLGESKVEGAPHRFNNIILCKTREGYWCDIGIPLKASRLLEEYLKNDPLLENL